MNWNMLLWVTSRCNLNCPLCMVKHTMGLLPAYEMSMEEVHRFITSSLERKIHYHTITLTGGEPTLWSNLEEAVSILYLVTDRIVLISNGSNLKAIKNILPYLSHYAISATQTDKYQVKRFKRLGKVIFNTAQHKPLPTEPLENTLPAICCNREDLIGNETNQVHYIAGKVYYCCYTLLSSDRVPIIPDMVCDFEEDFLSHFEGKAYDKTICQYCLCNKKVWNQIP